MSMTPEQDVIQAATIDDLVRPFVDEYEWGPSDENAYYTPNENERAMLEDALHGFISEHWPVSKPTPEGEQSLGVVVNMGGLPAGTITSLIVAASKFDDQPGHVANIRAVIDRLAALTPAQAEPVARLYTKQGHLPRLAFSVQPEAREADWTETPLYAAPQPAPVAERAAIVAWLREEHNPSFWHYAEQCLADKIEQGLHHRAQAAP